MKKVLFSVCALAALLTGCAKSDVVDAPNFETPITFEAYSGKVPVSKATSIDDGADLSGEGGFVVYAFNTTILDNVDYTPDWTSLYFTETLVLDGNAWKYVNSTEKYYWPSDGNALAFVAYSNNGGSTYVGPSEDNSFAAPSLTVTVPNAVADQKDVMVASFHKTKSDGNAVSLTFNHVLSRVHFQLTADRAITISSVKVNGAFYSTGTVDLIADTPSVVTDASDVESYEFLTGDFVLTPDQDENGDDESTTVDIDNTADVDDDHYMMLIPGKPESVVIEYKFNDDNTGSVYLATADLSGESFTFEKGTSYRFDLVLASQEITFNATVNGWGEDTEWGNSEALKFVVTKKNN